MYSGTSIYGSAKGLGKQAISELLEPHYESEAKCEAFHMKISFESEYMKIHTFELRKKE